MRIETTYQINEKDIIRKNKNVLLAKSKLNQQNRNYETKIYKHQKKNSIKG